MPRDREQFIPRDIDADELERLRVHVENIKSKGHPEALPTHWREEIAHDFSGCPHTTSAFIEVEGPHGVWGVEICVNCGAQHARECAHVRCDWLLDGDLLRCANCGCDAT